MPPGPGKFTSGSKRIEELLLMTGQYERWIRFSDLLLHAFQIRTQQNMRAHDHGGRAADSGEAMNGHGLPVTL